MAAKNMLFNIKSAIFVFQLQHYSYNQVKLTSTKFAKTHNQHALVMRLHAQRATSLLITIAMSVAAFATTPDSIQLSPTDSLPTAKKNPNLIQRVIRYFDDANEEKPDKKFDITFLGGPSYSESTSLQLALVAAGLYRTQRDTATTQSNISVFGQGSITGFYRVGVKGDHYSPGNKLHIAYHADFAHFPLKFWGLTFDDQRNKDNESDYTELQSSFWMELQWQLARNIFLGPLAEFNYGKATKIERPDLWRDEDTRMFNYGFGVVFAIDSRDLPTNASRGVLLSLKQKFFPRGIGNDYAFSSTEFTFAVYKQWWESGIMAMQLHSWNTYGNTPWTMLPTLDESNGIRGYYEGRYRAKNEADLVVELRQKVWRRNGIVVWGGIGTVFDNFDQIAKRRLLPSCGIGYRWEFKKRVNVRVDLGIGRGSTGFSLGLNETF